MIQVTPTRALQVTKKSTHINPCASIFIAGGISNCPNWQKEFVGYLEGLGEGRQSNGTLYNPRRDYFEQDMLEQQIMWECVHLYAADIISFWFCKETVCPTTLFELGQAIERGKSIYVGIEPGYVLEAGLYAQLRVANIPKERITNSLFGLAKLLIKHIY